MRSIFPHLYIFVLTIGVYYLTTHPYLGQFGMQATLFTLFLVTMYIYFSQHRKQSMMQGTRLVYFLAAFILCWVGSTGWFASPFSFGLHLLIVILSFFFPASVAISFAISLFIIIFIPKSGLDMTYRALELLSLLASIPISFYFRERYLHFKDGEKTIMILQKENEACDNKVQEVLRNSVTRFAAHMRGPLAEIKLFAHHLGKPHTPEHAEEERKRLIAAVENGLSLLRFFEEEATGKRQMSTPKHETLTPES